MRVISLYYEEEVRIWMMSNPGKVVTSCQISILFGAAFIHACTMQNALTLFRKMEIWPPDETVFTGDDFLPSATIDIQIVDSGTSTNQVITEEVNE